MRIFTQDLLTELDPEGVGKDPELCSQVAEAFITKLRSFAPKSRFEEAQQNNLIESVLRSACRKKVPFTATRLEDYIIAFGLGYNPAAYPTDRFKNPWPSSVTWLRREVGVCAQSVVHILQDTFKLPGFEKFKLSEDDVKSICVLFCSLLSGKVHRLDVEPPQTAVPTEDNPAESLAGLAAWEPAKCIFKSFLHSAVKGPKIESATDGAPSSGALLQSLTFAHLRCDCLAVGKAWMWICPDHPTMRNMMGNPECSYCRTECEKGDRAEGKVRSFKRSIHRTWLAKDHFYFRPSSGGYVEIRSLCYCRDCPVREDDQKAASAWEARRAELDAKGKRKFTQIDYTMVAEWVRNLSGGHLVIRTLNKIILKARSIAGDHLRGMLLGEVELLLDHRKKNVKNAAIRAREALQKPYQDPRTQPTRREPRFSENFFAPISGNMNCPLCHADCSGSMVEGLDVDWNAEQVSFDELDKINAVKSNLPETGQCSNSPDMLQRAGLVDGPDVTEISGGVPVAPDEKRRTADVINKVIARRTIDAQLVLRLHYYEYQTAEWISDVFKPYFEKHPVKDGRPRRMPAAWIRKVTKVSEADVCNWLRTAEAEIEEEMINDKE